MKMVTEAVEQILRALDGLAVELTEGRDVAEESLERGHDVGVPVARPHVNLQRVQKPPEFHPRGVWPCGDQATHSFDQGDGSFVVPGGVHHGGHRNREDGRRQPAGRGSTCPRILGR